MFPQYLVSRRIHHRKVSRRSFRLTAALQGALKLAELAQARCFRVSGSQACRNWAQGAVVQVDFLKWKKTQTTNMRNSAREKHSTLEKLKIPELIFSVKFWSLLPLF